MPSYKRASDKYATIVVDEIVAKTDRAVLCRINSDEHWIPFSQIEGDDEPEKGDVSVEINITKWILDRAGVSY